MSKSKNKKRGPFVKEANGHLWVLPFSREYEFKGEEKKFEGGGDEIFLSGSIADEIEGGPSLEELEELEPGSLVSIMYDPDTQELLILHVPGGLR